MEAAQLELPAHDPAEYYRRRARFLAWSDLTSSLNGRANRAETSTEREVWRRRAALADAHSRDAWARWAELPEPEFVHLDVVLDHPVEGRRYRAKVDLNHPHAKHGDFIIAAIRAQYWQEKVGAWRWVRNGSTLIRLWKLVLEREGTFRDTSNDPSRCAKANAER